MITYKAVGQFGFQVPILHDVHFNHHDRTEVIDWCWSNCKDKFYPGPSWKGHYVQFVDDEDAVWFKLRWS